MRLGEDECRRLLVGVRNAVLATTRPDGSPHAVPIVFAAIPSRDLLVTAVDAKPKTNRDLTRLRNIAHEPRVAVLAQRYDEDWSQLWWVRADGVATVENVGTQRDTAIEMLVRRYPQYEAEPPPGPAIVVRVTRWTGWSAGRSALS